MSYDRINTEGVRGTLYVGGAPQPSDRMQDWADTLVLCAMEYQPDVTDLEFGQIEILRMPLGDVNEPMKPAEYARCFAVSTKVAKRLLAGKRVVVTCLAGLNRSCLIAGMAMRMVGMGSDTVIRNLRAARGDRGLCNEAFERIVRTTVPGTVFDSLLRRGGLDDRRRR
jgi:hypothetical protein